jgi:hypothetical protein
MMICQPLQLTSTMGQFDALINVAAAAPRDRQAPFGTASLERSAIRTTSSARPLKRAGCLTRDPRMKEREEVRPARRSVQVPVLEAVETMLKVAVAGASGYMGAELLRLLSVHPKVQVTAVTSERLAGERLDSVYPHLRGLSDLSFRELDGEKLADTVDLVFLALPHMESQRAMPR